MASEIDSDNILSVSELAVELPGYDDLVVIDSGGSSLVYKARYAAMDRTVAIKILNKQGVSESALMRFQAEGKTLAALNHPNIVDIYKMGILPDDGTPYLVMEFLQGVNLKEYMNRRGALSGREFLFIFCSVLSALAFAHEKHVVHRDIKPENIFLVEHTPDISDGGASSETDAADSFKVKLLDFGIAKILADSDGSEQGSTRTVLLTGSPRYMSPEQCRSEKVDFRSDIYSLGCVMYESLAGKPLFDGNSPMEIMYKHLNADTVAMTSATTHRGMNAAIFKIIFRAINRDPKLRYQSATEMLSDLEKLEDSDIDRAGSKSRNLAPVFWVMLLLLIIATASFWLNNKRSSPAVNDLPRLRREAGQLFLEANRLFNQKAFEKSLSCFQRARECAVKLDLFKIQSQCDLKIGEILSANGNHDAAAKSFRSAVETGVRHNNPYEKESVNAEHNLGKELFLTGHLKESKKYFEKVRSKSSERHGIKELLVSSQYWLSRVAFKEKKPQEEIEYIRSNLRFMENPKHRDYGGIGLVLDSIRLLAEENQTAEARNELEQLKKVLPEIKFDRNDRKRVYAETAELCRKLGVNPDLEEFHTEIDVLLKEQDLAHPHRFGKRDLYFMLPRKLLENSRSRAE